MLFNLYFLLILLPFYLFSLAPLSLISAAVLLFDFYYPSGFLI